MDQQNEGRRLARQKLPPTRASDPSPLMGKLFDKVAPTRRPYC